LPPSESPDRDKQFPARHGTGRCGIFENDLNEIGMERSATAAGETIKGELHKTPTTVFEPQLFLAQHPGKEPHY
jgi:hypothetical protein